MKREGLTCEVQTCEGDEVLHVVMSQFHHDQADQSPAEEEEKVWMQIVRGGPYV